MNSKFIKNSIGLFLLSLLLCSTDCGSTESAILSIRNESGKTVIIKSYTDKVLQKTINLKIDEIYSKKFHSTLGAGINTREIFEADRGLPVDSLIIIYSNKKKKSWSSNLIKTGDDYLNAIYDINTSSFVLTENDYHNATDCNGNCE